MAVGGFRRINPYGPPSMFGEDEAARPSYMGFLDVAGQRGVPQLPGVGASIEAAQGVQPEMFEPIQAPEQDANGGAMAGGDAQDYPSEAAINRRLKLAEALMGQQQEVNHPLQAIGNAVSKISGAYLESKAQKDLEAAEKRRLNTWKDVLAKGGGDPNALADGLIASGDAELVKQGLGLKIKAYEAKARRGGKPVQMIKGNQYVYVDEETGEEIPGFGGPRYKEGGGGDGDGSGGSSVKYQQVNMLLPDGRVVLASYNPREGRAYYQDEKGALTPLPSGSRPATASTGGMLPASAWLKLKTDRQEGINALNAIDDYAAQAGGLPQGYRRWATGLSARFKTWLGQQGLSQQEFDLMSASAKQQALLGMLRTTIVGPGVMTEYDAQRVIQAMGGNPTSALQNPEVMTSILQNLYERKRHELSAIQTEYERNAPTFGEQPEPLPLPRHLGQEPSRQAPQAEPLPPPEQRIIGKTERKASDGNTYLWSKNAAGKVGWVRKR